MNIELMLRTGNEYMILFIGIYLIILLASWIIGERFYQKRHKDKHQPLLKIISEQLKELEKAENNTSIN